MVRATAAVALISLAAGSLLFVQPSGVRGPAVEGRLAAAAARSVA
eukprot:CAMPEP_0116947778 /NCGR_PEP_ID=MMETSP0467-20121206/37890_1 /TAXON_ID=283647 /ORGANISM="Mesodinium pulex, Strain SPMC105" /LENGTH=44 /DNA_ID= /DNA_START= /DNA_END= /DNA_ORIENTATION=